MRWKVLRWRRDWSLVLGLAAVLFGLARAVVAAGPGNDRCYLENIERWRFAGLIAVWQAEFQFCRNSGCTGPGESCPSTPVNWSPTNVGDQDGDGEDDFEYRKSCDCVNGYEGDESVGLYWCETVSVERNWMSGEDRTVVECYNYSCSSCSVLTEYNPDPPTPPGEYLKQQTCRCN